MDQHPAFTDVLESAARLQQLVPDCVLVRRSAAAYHVRHRVSFDHDHVLADLRDRFDAVLDALETDDGWAVNRMVPGTIILGELGGIETGVRQMIRSRPLEVQDALLASGATLVVPTIEEALRIKAFLIVRRNQVRDYLDVAALSERIGDERSGVLLAAIGDYYVDDTSSELAVASQLVRQLADPQPRDVDIIDELDSYRRLDPRWTWDAVCAQLADVSLAMVDATEQPAAELPATEPS